jgi:Flavodoxins
MKTGILYVSVHHGNTKKIVQIMAETLSADLIDLTKEKNPDISGYDVLGFASGSFYQAMHEQIVNFVRNTDFGQNKKAFLVCTCGANIRDYTSGVKKLLKQKGVQVTGSFQCRGFDTFGPFGKIGGIAKNHPDERDYDNARKFAASLIKA